MTPRQSLCRFLAYVCLLAAVLIAAGGVVSLLTGGGLTFGSVYPALVFGGMAWYAWVQSKVTASPPAES